MYTFLDFPAGSAGKESACQWRRCKRCGFDPWVGKIPWRREWQPTPILPGKFLSTLTCTCIFSVNLKTNLQCFSIDDFRSVLDC